MLDLHFTTVDIFRAALMSARMNDDRIHGATSEPYQMPDSARYFLTADGLSGFGVTDENELVGLFSLVKGRGDDLVGWAVGLGAEKLDCFDGYLPTLYRRHGFTEYKREPNWTAGNPDVVYMRCI